MHPSTAGYSAKQKVRKRRGEKKGKGKGNERIGIPTSSSEEKKTV
jgi:hypothetical protein